MEGTEAPSNEKPTQSFDQIANESKERISSDLKSDPKIKTGPKESNSAPASDPAANPGTPGVAVYQPTIVASVVEGATKTLCNSRAENTKIDSWRVGDEEAKAVGQSIDHLLQVWFPDLGNGNPKVQTAITAVMTCGYVFGSRALAESRIKAEAKRMAAEAQRQTSAAQKPEEQPAGSYTDVAPTSVDGMQ